MPSGHPLSARQQLRHGALLPLESILSDAVEEFFIARQPKKPSAHAKCAFRQDLAAISAEVADTVAARPADQLRLEQITIPALRRAFAPYADDPRRGVDLAGLVGMEPTLRVPRRRRRRRRQPLAAVAKPQAPKAKPKAPKANQTPLRGPDTADELLERIAAGARQARFPWPVTGRSWSPSAPG